MRKFKFAAILLLALLVAVGVSAFAYVKTPSGIAYALRMANKTGLSTKLLCVYAPDQEVAFDTLGEDKLRDWNASLRYVVNPQNLSVVHAAKGSALRQRFVPSEQGSERVVAVFQVEGRTTYELKQSVYLEEGFDWGGDIESGKVGFGLGGGSAPTGGTTDKDGFTARLAFRGHGDGTADATLYLYSADRTLNLPYGDEFPIPNFVMPIGEWFDIAIRLTVNSELDLADGEISVRVNDEPLLERTDIQWQTEGDQPIIDRLIFSSFHGGNKPDWSPEATVYAQFAEVCLHN